MTYDEDLEDRVYEALEAREALSACPRCGGTTWGALDQYVPLAGHVSENGSAPLVAVGLVCATCAYLVLHAAAQLGLDPD